MRVFVGYGYNARDKWVEDYVFPLAVAFGCYLVHGKLVYGGALPDEIIKMIRLSDAMLGFTTRREPSGEGLYRTHPWVVQELLTAHAGDLPWVEVREAGVESPGGILDAAGTQRIEYQETERADCLVKIAQALSRFRELTSIVTVRLGPATAVDDISPFLNDNTFSCTCETVRGARESSPAAFLSDQSRAVFLFSSVALSPRSWFALRFPREAACGAPHTKPWIL
jgi:hypothetical protein